MGTNKKNLWPYAIISAFVLVFIAGGTTLYLALESDPGSINGAYTKALEFDKNQADLKTATGLGLSVKASPNGVRVTLPGDYSEARISGGAASNKREDFISEKLEKIGAEYVLSRRLSPGTWFLSLKFDELEFSVTRFVSIN